MLSLQMNFNTNAMAPTINKQKQKLYGPQIC